MHRSPAVVIWGSADFPTACSFQAGGPSIWAALLVCVRRSAGWNLPCRNYQAKRHHTNPKK